MLNTTRKGDRTPKGKRVAMLEISGAGKLTLRDRRALAKWLRAQADHLLASGHEYDKRFTGVYLA